MVTDLDKDTLRAAIETSGVIVLDFWAPWCGPCRAFAPIFEQAATDFPDITFGKVNTEVEQELAAVFNIRSIPTLMVFRDQILLYSQPGSLPRTALDQLIAQVMALDMAAVRTEIAAQDNNPAPDSA